MVLPNIVFLMLGLCFKVLNLTDFDFIVAIYSFSDASLSFSSSPSSWIEARNGSDSIPIGA